MIFKTLKNTFTIQEYQVDFMINYKPNKDYYYYYKIVIRFHPNIVILILSIVIAAYRD